MRLTISFWLVAIYLVGWYGLMMLAIAWGVAATFNFLVNTNKLLQRAVQPNSAVLVTGASSGIGELTALRLAAAGFVVFAGVRKEEYGVELRKKSRWADRIRPVRLDVTDELQVQAARESIEAAMRSEGLKLVGLVNNAGFGQFEALEMMTMEQLGEQFEVNVFGQVRVTNEFVGLLRETRGRVVFVTSEVSSLVIPFSAAYAASKWALEAIGDGYRNELAHWGVHVTLLQPGAFRTKFSRFLENKGEPSSSAAVKEEGVRGWYATKKEQFFKEFEQKIEPRFPTAEVVAERVENVLRARFPPVRITVGAPMKPLHGIIIPDRLIDFGLRRLFKLN